MEVILAKKQLQQRLTSNVAVVSRGVSPGQRIAVDCRVVVKEGREFASFRTGDEGVVLGIDGEAGHCEVAFDGSSCPITVALRHLSVAAARGPGRKPSPRRAAAAPVRAASTGRAVVAYRQASSATAAGPKTTVSRWKTVLKESEARGTSPPRAAPAVPSTWQNDSDPLSPLLKQGGGSNALSPSIDAASETVTEPADVDATMRRALRESAAAIEASLRVAQSMKIEQADMLGHRNKIIVLSEDTFAEWKQTIEALQVAGAFCSKALQGLAPRSMPLGAPIEVPVESVGYRPNLAVAWPPAPAFRAPPAFGPDGQAAQMVIARSASAPLLDVDSTEQLFKWSPFSNTEVGQRLAAALVSPRSTSGLPGGPAQSGDAALLCSPRCIQGGVSSASRLGADHAPLGGSAFAPSLPAFSEVAASAGGPPLFASDVAALSSPRFAPAGVALPRAALVPPGHTFLEGGVPLQPWQPQCPGFPMAGIPNTRDPHARDLNAREPQCPGVPMRSPSGTILNAVPMLSAVPPQEDGGRQRHRAWVGSVTTPGSRRAKRDSRPSKIAQWLTDELSSLHKGLLGGGDSESEEYEEPFTYAL